MLSSRKLIFAFVSLALSSAAPVFAQLLPDGTIVARQSTKIDVLELKDVQLTHQVVKPATSTSVASISAILEIHAIVEGNLCSGDPNTVQLDARREKSKVRLALSLSSAYDPYHPPAFPTACAAFSAPRSVTIPVAMTDYIFDGSEKTKEFVLAVHRPVSTEYDDVQISLAVTPNGYEIKKP